MHFPTSAQHQSARPDRITLRAAGPISSDGIDAAAGSIRGISLMISGREAAGHGLFIDGKTVDGFLAKMSGRALKAYATHRGEPDSTLDEVGLWTNSRIDFSGLAPQLRGDFTALDSWRKHNPDEFDTLFELATKAPNEFGASLAFRFSAVWVKGDGSEIPTVRKFGSAAANRGFSYDPPMPAGALRNVPSVRPIEVYSCDFVDEPAANDGLFRAGPSSTSADVPTERTIYRRAFFQLSAKAQLAYVKAGGTVTDDPDSKPGDWRERGIEGCGSPSTPTITREEFNRLSPQQGLDFCNAGGSLRD